MKTHVSKAAKVALCRECGGTGVKWVPGTRKGLAGLLRWKGVQIKEEVCPNCKGSGRVLVSCEADYEIMPYDPGMGKLEY